MKSNLNDKAVDEFLYSQRKKNTFKSYKTVMKQYLEFAGKTRQQLLDIKKADTTFQVENSMLNYRKHHAIPCIPLYIFSLPLMLYIMKK